MTTPLEERLRAHYADRTQREALPGPDTTEALTGTLDRVSERVVHPVDLRGRRNHLWLAVAAATVVVLGAVAVVAATRGDDGSTVDLGPAGETDDTDDPRPTTTTTPTTEPPGSTSSTSLVSGPMSGTAIVVGLDGVIGWWDGSAWVQPDPWGQPPVPATGDERYSHVRLDEPITSSGGTTVTGCDPSGTPTIDAGLTDPGGRLDPKPVAVSGVENPRPRPVEVLDPSNSEYVPAVAQVLAGLGIDEPQPSVEQAIRVDLDGDGTDEVLVSTDRITEPELYASDGDYSVTFVRRVVGGAVQTTVISAMVYEAQPDSTPYLPYERFGALADLNGDGRMEIVVTWSAYEGRGVDVYEFRSDGSVAEVLSGGCGV